jgi:hypothetical protein
LRQRLYTAYSDSSWPTVIIIVIIIVVVVLCVIVMFVIFFLCKWGQKQSDV